MQRLSLLLVFLLSALSVELAAQDELTDSQVAWFEKKVRPLLIQKCYACHAESKGESEGGLTLDSRAGWQKGGDHGPAIVPKDPQASLLIRAVQYQDDDLAMPPDKKLTVEEIKTLEEWVKLGAPDPRSGQAIQPQTSNPADPVAGKSHWAFQPLTSKLPPNDSQQETDAISPNSPIDRFVRQKLKQVDLSANRIAEKSTLVRRIHIALTGLPPTYEQVQEFEQDSSADAVEHLVDRLLASPQFGERWGRHWLDLARYADSNGLDENFLFREAWRYRNWVINALNDDQPFDHFATEQLAGDLLPFDSIEQRDRQRIAAGFLVVGPKVLLGVNGELQKMDVADELIDTVGTTFLGQTLGCARCHDHKFDPIPTEDYYALAGIFTSTEVMQTRYMLGQQRKMERLFGLGPDENKKNSAYEKYWREIASLRQRVEKANKSVEQLKNAQSNLDELLTKYADVLADEVKNLIQSRKKKNVKESDEAALTNDEMLRKRLLQIQKRHLNEQAKRLAPPPIPPRAMIPTDKPQPADEFIRVAGQFNRKSKSVPRGFLQVLSETDANVPDKASGRQELAAWLTDTEHGAGRLTARVLANRIWHHMLGQGIVRTTDNFGRQGEKPSHPKMLDYLAKRLINSGWSVKALIREIALSHTFQQSSRHNLAAHAKDPDNRLYWRAARRRLSAEAFRDSVLLSAGALDERPLNSTVHYLGDQATAVGANTNRRRTNFPNRSVYLPVIRNDLPEVFEAFDFADTHRTTGARPQTTVATTGLFILNDSLLAKSSKTLAQKTIAIPGLSETDRVRHIFRKIVLTDPTSVEVSQFLKYVAAIETLALKEFNSQGNVDSSADKNEKSKSTTIRHDKAAKMDENTKKTTEAKIKAWSTACHALFASSRFQIVE